MDDARTKMPRKIEDAAALLRDSWGNGAVSFAKARRLECVFYQDRSGLRYWARMERYLTDMGCPSRVAAND